LGDWRPSLKQNIMAANGSLAENETSRNLKVKMEVRCLLCTNITYKRHRQNKLDDKSSYLVVVFE